MRRSHNAGARCHGAVPSLTGTETNPNMGATVPNRELTGKHPSVTEETLERHRSCIAPCVQNRTLLVLDVPPTLPSSTMTARASDVAAPMFPPGVYTELFHGRQVFYAYMGDGSLVPGPMVPIGDETDDDIIVALADAVAAGAHLPPLALVTADHPLWAVEPPVSAGASPFSVAVPPLRVVPRHALGRP
jgi:hypothetical protein